MRGEVVVKLEISANDSSISKGQNLIYRCTILNQSCKHIDNVILNFHITQGLSFVEGAVKRQRGILDIDKDYIDLQIGNLAPKEEAAVRLEFKLNQSLVEIKAYGTITFTCGKKIKTKTSSNIISKKKCWSE